MVEVGYSIDPRFRRQGYARAALRALLDRAGLEPGVTTVRASISPRATSPPATSSSPTASWPVGEQEDDEDGLEIVYEVRRFGAAPAADRA